MRKVKEYHHFKPELIEQDDRVSRYERYVVNLLLSSSLPDFERESTVCWELKHQASMRQFASILARKRNLPIDVCVVGVLLHDVCSIIHGEYKNHAQRGANIALEILNELGGFSEDEQNQIWRIVYHHSDKHVWTEDQFQEIGKDVDVLDCFLYEGAFDYYLSNKPLSVFREYTRRAKMVWDELGIPIDPRLDILDSYGPAWFEEFRFLETDVLRHILSSIIGLGDFSKSPCYKPPPFAVVIEEHGGRFFANRKCWSEYKDFLSSGDVARSLGINLTVVDLVLTYLMWSSTDPFDGDCGCQDSQLVDEVTKIIDTHGELRGEDRHAFLFWPLIGIYEELAGELATKRLRELGLVSMKCD